MIEARHRREGPHAAGVRTAVAVEHGLVILRDRERRDVPTAHEDEERHLLADEKLLDDDRRAGGAELAALHARREGGVRFLERGAHDGAFAGGEAVGLDDERRTKIAAESACPRRIGERLEAGGRDRVPSHHRLGERLGAFDRGRPCARPEHREAGGGQPVGESRHQRHLGTDHDHIRPLLVGKPHERVVIVDGHGDTRGVTRDARIARCRHEPREQRTLRDLPAERVLAAAAADDEDVHSLPSPGVSTSSRWARAILAHGLPASSWR